MAKFYFASLHFWACLVIARTESLLPHFPGGRWNSPFFSPTDRTENPAKSYFWGEGFPCPEWGGLVETENPISTHARIFIRVKFSLPHVFYLAEGVLRIIKCALSFILELMPNGIECHYRCLFTFIIIFFFLTLLIFNFTFLPHVKCHWECLTFFYFIFYDNGTVDFFEESAAKTV